MKKLVKRIIKTLLQKRGSKIVPIEYHAVELKVSSQLTYNALNFTLMDKIDSIIFSKDRAMQLNAFIESYLCKGLNNLGLLCVLYRCSNAVHKASYDELKAIYAKEQIIWVEEQDFAIQLRERLHQSQAKTIGFFVDDMIFINEVDFSKILKLTDGSSVVALTRGKNLIFSQVLNMKLDVPPMYQIDGEFYEFDWGYGDVFSDWTFPAGVSGYFFSRSEITALIDNIVFKAPNTLEGAMCKFANILKLHKGICMETMACICVQANLVQTEYQNNILGTFSVDELLVLWNQGKKIDLNQFYGADGNEAQFFQYTFIPRIN